MLLDNLLETLQTAITDVSQSTASDAYITFFKDIVFAPIVEGILTNITTGAPITPGPHIIRNAPPELFGSPVTPQFLCVTDYNQMTWSIESGGQGGQQFDAFDGCRSPVHAYNVLGSKFLNNTIVICDRFWDYPAFPPDSNSACLNVDPNFNRFRESGARMINYQLWVILSSLVQNYAYARSGRLVDVATANDCRSLSARNAAASPRNYVLYAASELTFIIVAFVRSMSYWQFIAY